MSGHFDSLRRTDLRRQGSPVPLSRSPLWEAQRDYFQRQGIDAWREEIVPSYITSNPFIARAYAEIVLAHLDDGAERGPVAATDGGGQPAYVVELGTGSGRFSFYFLRHFFARYDSRATAGRRVCYVMTDLVEENISFWRRQEKLRPYVERGVLDFARFDACGDRSLELLVSGRSIGPAAQGKPLVVIANYVFDGTEHDAFEVRRGRLYECLVTASEGGRPWDGGTLPADVSLDYHPRRCSVDHYRRSDWDDLLRFYRRRLPGGAFTLPVGALRCLETLGRLASGSLLVLCADKGQSRLDELTGSPRPQPTHHGSFSLDVNYHALSRWAGRQQGGEALELPRAADHLVVMGLLFGCRPGRARRTRRAFEASTSPFGPDEYYTLKKAMEGCYRHLTAEQMVAFWRLSLWDQRVFLNLYDDLIERLPRVGPALGRTLSEGIEAMWEQSYPVEKRPDLAFRCGCVLANIGYCDQALAFFCRSRGGHGAHATLAFNEALCHLALGMPRPALKRADEAIRLAPAMRTAHLLRDAIRGYLPANSNP